MTEREWNSNLMSLTEIATMKSVVNTDRARAARISFQSIKSKVAACELRVSDKRLRSRDATCVKTSDISLKIHKILIKISRQPRFIRMPTLFPRAITGTNLISLFSLRIHVDCGEQPRRGLFQTALVDHATDAFPYHTPALQLFNFVYERHRKTRSFVYVVS